MRHSVSQSVSQFVVAAWIWRSLTVETLRLPAFRQLFQLDRLQAVMNAEARFVFQTNRYDENSNTPLFCRLHWLCEPQRIPFTLAVVVYQFIRGLGPAYHADALRPVGIFTKPTACRASCIFNILCNGGLFTFFSSVNILLIFIW